MYKSSSQSYYYGLQNKNINKTAKNMSMSPIKTNKFTFENSVEKLKILPLNADEYHPIKWLNITSINAQIKIFPKTFTQDTFNQGNTGLCFLFYFHACLLLPQFLVLFIVYLEIMIIGDRKNHLECICFIITKENK